jgi:uncharacterized protein (DUF1684 family)
VSLQTLEWRREVLALYSVVRHAPDPVAGHQIWREERDVLLKTHPVSPVPPQARASYPGADVRPYDPAYRFTCRIVDAEPMRLDVPTTTDGVIPFERIGRAELPGLGSLDVWWLDSYGGGVFIPVKDALAGRGTYGGGRYLIDTVKGADLGGRHGELVLDLNFAYQPSCAYDPAWVCPLAPPGNVLPVELPVGEFYRG